MRLFRSSKQQPKAIRILMLRLPQPAKCNQPELPPCLLLANLNEETSPHPATALKESREHGCPFFGTHKSANNQLLNLRRGSVGL
jgi:hypothetical protein